MAAEPARGAVSVSGLISRLALAELETRLAHFPAVALLGPRQVGKTTLALQLAAQRPSVYLDLEAPADQARLSDPSLYLASQAHKLVVLDEVQRLPGLFGSLRGLIDAGRRNGQSNGRFLLLGSASVDLIRQSSESLAGRISFLELGGLNLMEVAPHQREELWIRGGFPDSLLAADAATSSL
jgi:predicted AAA+ superfamily ATPase